MPFEKRSLHFLQISRQTALPLVLLIRDPDTFTEVHLQAVLAALRDILPVHLALDPQSGELTTAPTVAQENSTQVYSADGIAFTYTFANRSHRLNILVPNSVEKSCESLANRDVSMKDATATESADELYQGGKYRGLLLTPHTLTIVMLDPNEPLPSSEHTLAISHYFHDSQESSEPSADTGKKKKQSSKNASRSSSRKRSVPGTEVLAMPKTTPRRKPSSQRTAASPRSETASTAPKSGLQSFKESVRRSRGE